MKVELMDKANELGKNEIVYKYIKLKYLKKMLAEKNKKWTLLRTNSWPDAYENFYLKHKCLLEKESNLYGQSWTLRGKKCADAMWRLYSGTSNDSTKEIDDLDEVAVKIHTKIATLCDVLNSDPTNTATAYLGKVHYKNKKSLRDWVDNHKLVDDRAIRDSLFIKKKCV